MTSATASSQVTHGTLPAQAKCERSAVAPTWQVRLADFAELAKLRISTMVLVTVTVGYTLASQGAWQLSVLLPTLLGVTLTAAASSGLNQLLERKTDGLMARTLNRPLPAGRMRPIEVLAFSGLCAVAGLALLLLLVNQTTAVLTGLTLVLYVGLYTPLKRRTSLCTALGAIPGAIPPVLGWTAAGGALDQGALSLFAILFLWQFPHFLAIAWLYRHQYEQAGLRMLPARRATHLVGLLAVTYAVALIPVSLLPRHTGLAGDLYQAMALLLGLGYAWAAVRFARHECVASARWLLWASLIYLPTLLLTLMLDHWRLLL